MVADIRRTYVLTDDGAAHTQDFAGSEMYTRACVQIVGSVPACSFTLQGSVDGTNYEDIGEQVDGSIAAITADGLLFYTKSLPLKLRLNYSATNNPAADVVAKLLLIDSLFGVATPPGRI